MMGPLHSIHSGIPLDCWPDTDRAIRGLQCPRLLARGYRTNLASLLSSCRDATTAGEVLAKSESGRCRVDREEAHRPAGLIADCEAEEGSGSGELLRGDEMPQEASLLHDLSSLLPIAPAPETIVSPVGT